MGTLYYGDNLDSRQGNIWFGHLAQYILNVLKILCGR